ncbi:CinA-like protein [Clostridiales bacterium]|nr:CinA-like protein [Clostridiales bacterium]
MIATRHSGTGVKKGDKLAGMRVIPLVVREEVLERTEKIFDGRPILKVTPYRLKTAGIITTGSEVFRGIIEDTFTPVIIDKLKKFGIEVSKHIVVDDGTENILRAINEIKSSGTDMILCTGGMSVDPDDNTPGAIKQSGANIVTYGAPVLPGAMFLLGYFADDVPIMGLPGCVMYAGATIFDIVLPKIAARLKVDKRDIVKLGNGGLCLGCEECRYPVCPFGK